MSEEFHKVRRLPPYVFEQVNRLKASARAAGADIIDLGMGNPDLPTPQNIVDKLCEAVQDPRAHRYSASKGIPGLRRAQAQYYARRFGVKLNPDTQVVATLGSKEGDYWKKLQMVLSRFSMQPDPSWATAWFTRDQIGVWNWERFDSEEFDKLNAEGMVELDPAKRDVIYKKLQDLMEESGCYVFLTHEVTGIMYRDSVNAALKPNGEPVFTDFKPV